MDWKKSLIDMYDFNDCLDILKNKNFKNEQTILRLEAENKRLKEEYSKDEEIQELQNQLKKLREDSYRGFPITEDEQENIVFWKQQHEKESHSEGNNVLGCGGGKYSYHFYPCAIGVSGTIRCICGAEFEFQNIE